MIGTWCQRSKSWLRGWANESVDARLTEPIIPVKRFGEANGVESLWRMKTDANEDDAFALAACALDVLPSLEGIHRGPREAMSLFLGVLETRHVA